MIRPPHSVSVRVIALSLAASTAWAGGELAEGADPPEIRWEPFPARAHDGSPLEGRLGRIGVPEDRSDPEAGEIEIAFVVYETENPEPGPPIFFLVGGPGGSGVEYAALTATHRMLPLLEHCDVIGIDQRGTGLSLPNLTAGPTFAYSLPLDEPLERADVVAAQERAMAQCHAYYSEQGVNLDAYNTAESADDLDDVRRALGHEQVVLWGTSYGSHLGLAYLRRHPGGAARAVLSRVEGPDQTFKLPSSVNGVFTQLGERFGADVGAELLPDLLGTVGDLLAELAEEPVVVAVEDGEGNTAEVVCGPYDLQLSLAGRLADTRGHVFLPGFVRELTLGNFSELGQEAVEHRTGDMWSGMAMMMDCSSWMTAARAKRYERERVDAQYPLSDALSWPLYPATCTGCGSPDLGDAFRAPFECEVPVVFVSGALDARTPPSNVEELRAGFPNSVHVLVENAGHDGRELLSEEYRQLVTGFLHGEAVEDTVIALRWDRFGPLREE